jgi:hypothetical protein
MFYGVMELSYVPQTSCSSANIALGHRESLSIVQRFNSSQGIEILKEQVGELDQVLSSLFGGDLSPLAFKSFAGSSNGDVYVFLSGLMDRGDHSLVAGVDDFKGLAIYTFDKFIVDEPAEA